MQYIFRNRHYDGKGYHLSPTVIAMIPLYFNRIQVSTRVVQWLPHSLLQRRQVSVIAADTNSIKRQSSLLAT